MLTPFAVQVTDPRPVVEVGAGVTVAVKLTVCPPVEGSGEAVRTVLVGAGFTTCDKAGLLLPALLLSPE
jgi:hypothetical protein